MSGRATVAEYSYLCMVAFTRMSLSQFHPLIAEWFHQQVGQPTDVQMQAWPAIQSCMDASSAVPILLGKKLAVIYS